MNLRVKICGLTTPEAVEAAKDADYLGFVFFPASPRNLTPEKAAALTASVSLPTVAVTVDPSDELIRTILGSFRPAYLQLHGSESLARIAEIKKTFHIHIIKAFAVRNSDDVAKAHAYESVTDMLMFDAKAPSGLPGGTGLAFDWQLLAGRSFRKPWFLSGGLNESNVEEAVRISGTKAVDVSSSIESSPGIKDPALVRAFIAKAKSLS